MYILKKSGNVRAYVILKRVRETAVAEEEQ